MSRLVSIVRHRQLESDLDERVEHLVLVVHGIGDALMSVDLGVVQLRSLVECCDTLRAHHEEVSPRPGRGGGAPVSRTQPGTCTSRTTIGFVDVLLACTALSRHPRFCKTSRKETSTARKFGVKYLSEVTFEHTHELVEDGAPREMGLRGGKGRAGKSFTGDIWATVHVAGCL